jgi:hypothetical protein
MQSTSYLKQINAALTQHFVQYQLAHTNTDDARVLLSFGRYKTLHDALRQAVGDMRQR